MRVNNYFHWIMTWIAVVVMFAGTEVAAGPPVVEPVPRACTLDDGSGHGTVEVQVCPDTEGCPFVTQCSDDSGLCALWTYRFDWGDIRPNFVGLSVAADVPIISTIPEARETPPGEKEPTFGVGKNEFSRRWLRFRVHDRHTEVMIETSAEFARGAAGTAAATGKNFRALCLILAPGVRVGDPQRPQTVQVVDELPCGQVTRFVDSEGRTIHVEAPKECDMTTSTITNAEGQRLVYVSPGAVLIFDDPKKQDPATPPVMRTCYPFPTPTNVAGVLCFP